MENLEVDTEFWRSSKIFITGHTGFMGTWLSLCLLDLGSEVYGYALEPNTRPAMFDLVPTNRYKKHQIGDVNSYETLLSAVEDAKPDIVFHLAAQPIVLESYSNPLSTFRTNILGTTNLLEAIRSSSTTKVVINITSDKCYEECTTESGYTESDRLGGHDPYSSSKACSELVTTAYRSSFFHDRSIGISTARVGNIIGGGDWAKNRIVPDAIRAFADNLPLFIRHPGASRPWQHVLEPIRGYLILAQQMILNPGEYSDAWNFGPDPTESKPVEQLANRLASLWGGNACCEIDVRNSTLHEANQLSLNSSYARQQLSWRPIWDFNRTTKETVDWYLASTNNDNMLEFSRRQVTNYLKESNKVG